jgi:hypothetical protein
MIGAFGRLKPFSSPHQLPDIFSISTAASPSGRCRGTFPPGAAVPSRVSKARVVVAAAHIRAVSGWSWRHDTRLEACPLARLAVCGLGVYLNARRGPGAILPLASGRAWLKNPHDDQRRGRQRACSTAWPRQLQWAMTRAISRMPSWC